MKKVKWLLLVSALSSIGLSVIPAIANADTETNDFYIKKVENMPDDFIKGADISTIIAQEQSGVRYYNEAGNEQDLFTILSDNGVNYIRLRVWNDPYNEDGQGYGAGNCDVPKAIEMGKRATAAGMKVLIDFHYSDFWADPGRQIPPKAWTNYSLEQKADALYEFTKTSLQEMIDAGVDVGMVQIGNETTGSGIAGEAGEGRYDLFRAGSKAVREVDPTIQIALHFTNPDRTSTILNYAKALETNQIDYDVFATSYYAFWHGSLDNLTYVLNTVAETYGKKTMVAETSYAYTLEDGDGQKNVVNSTAQTNIGGYPATVQGQANSLRDVMDATVKAGEDAIGVFYWEPAWTPVGATDREANMPIWEEYGSGWASTAAIGYDTAVDETNYGGSEWDNQALFDFNGKALDSLKVFKYGAEGYGEIPIARESLLKNSSFEEADLSPYEISQSYVSRKSDTPKSGNQALHFYNSRAVDFTAQQSLELEAGKYQFELDIQGGDAGASEEIYTYAKVDGNVLATSENVHLAGHTIWQKPTLTFEVTEKTLVTLGLSVKGDAGAWGTSDDWMLERIGDAEENVEAEAITLNVTGLKQLKKGKTLALVPEIAPANATDKTLEWIVENPKIVSIDENNVLTAQKTGTTRVTVKTRNDKEASFTIRVTK